MYKFDFIQLFALPVVTGPVQTTGLNTPGSGGERGNDLSPEMKTYYDMRLIDYAQAQLVHDQFGQKRPIPKNGGKTIEFRSFTPLPKALDPLTEGVTPTGNTLDVTSITATVAQYGDYIVQSDVLELTALDNTILEATKILGRQAGLTLDTVTRNVLNGYPSAMFAPKLSGSSETPVLYRRDLDATAKLTVDLVEQAVTELRAQNAPTINGDYVCILHPYAAYDLMRDADWRKPHEYVDTDGIYQGEIGKIAGCRFVTSTEAKIFWGADLASDSRTLAVNGNVSASATVTFDGGTVAEHALKNRQVIIGSNLYTVSDNTTSTLTLSETATISNDTVIYPGEGGAAGVAVFSCLFLAEGAYGITEVEGGGLTTIVKQKGSAGTADPLDQRSSVGWKAIKTAEILIPSYMIRLECCSSRYSATAKGN